MNDSDESEEGITIRRHKSRPIPDLDESTISIKGDGDTVSDFITLNRGLGEEETDSDQTTADLSDSGESNQEGDNQAADQKSRSNPPIIIISSDSEDDLPPLKRLSKPKVRQQKRTISLCGSDSFVDLNESDDSSCEPLNSSDLDFIDDSSVNEENPYKPGEIFSQILECKHNRPKRQKNSRCVIFDLLVHLPS